MQKILRSVLLLLTLAGVVLAQNPPVGQWKFDDPANLMKAVTGTDLVATGSPVDTDGPGIQNEAVLIPVGSYMTMTHGIPANGGGSYLNEWSLLIDFKIPALGSWYTFFQTNTANSNDGDCFIKPTGEIGVGSTGYATQTIEAETWYRLVISVKNGDHFNYYLDGKLLHEGGPMDIDGRFGLDPVLLMFADNDGDDAEMACAEIAMWDYPLSAEEARSLGGYHGKTGWWRFNDAGDPLYTQSGEALTLVGTHETMAGVDANDGAVKIGVGSHYSWTHGMPANGGGSKVNEWTMMVDFKFPQTGVWHTLFQVDQTNGSDGECFINTFGNLGVGVTGYSTRALETETWYRLAISVDLGDHYNYYLDGNLLHQGTVQNIDERFALENILLFFADNDAEDEELHVSELSFWNRSLSADEVHSLGGFNPDTTAPAAPEGVTAIVVPGEYFNLVTWQAVPNEENEVYSVYASEWPINDLEAPGVEMLAQNLSADDISYGHFIFYPKNDHNIDYYYAVTCQDESGNVGPAGFSGVITNLAKGVPTISLELPATVTIDGDIAEWYASSLEPLVLQPVNGEFGHVGQGSFDNNDDMTATVYMAVDDNYLYYAVDVLDNVYSFDPAGDWWYDDAAEIFIGLYNTTTKHAGYQRGAEPDYQMVVATEYFYVSQLGSEPPLFTNDDENYEFVDYGSSDWSFEVKIPLDSLAANGDARFHAQNGMKITTDIQFHDSDAILNEREGILNFSTLSNDVSWQGAQYWTFTWVGDTNRVSSVDREDSGVPAQFSLSQNYPNPFNPATTFSYTLNRPGFVEIDLFNIQGQKVRTLVSTTQSAGLHQVVLDASGLSSGIYFYRLKSGSQIQTRKMTLVR